jgi:hypothetical protein
LARNSIGSKFGTIAAIVITIAFFLPWIRACGTELSGYDIATNKTGMVEEAWMYWGTLLAGLICIALFFLLRTDSRRQKIWTGIIRLVVSLLGFFPLLNVWLNVRERGGAMEILYGGWIIGLGYLGIFISSIIDFLDFGVPADEATTQTQYTLSGSSQSRENEFEWEQTQQTEQTSAGIAVTPDQSSNLPAVSPREVESVSQLDKPAEQKPVLRFCGQCGSRLPKEAAFCPNCGNHL